MAGQPSTASLSESEMKKNGEEQGILDMETFGQLLDMDDDDTHEFSKELAHQYVEQAESTFEEMDEALGKKDLEKLSKLGHFLKGSSASVGLLAVSTRCTAMQNYGSCKDEAGTSSISSEEALKSCTELIPKLKTEQAKAKKWLKDFYKEKW